MVAGNGLPLALASEMNVAGPVELLAAHRLPTYVAADAVEAANSDMVATAAIAISLDCMLLPSSK
jgi:hypothetical protein